MILPVLLFLYLATLAGFVFFRNLKPVYFRLLPVILLFTAISETWVTALGHDKQKLVFYNIFSLIEIAGWSVILICNNNYRRKGVHIAIVAAIFAGSLVEILYRKGFHSYTYRAFSLYCLASCLYYFYQLTELKRQARIHTRGPFWMLMGLFIFQLVMAFYLTALDFKEFRKATDAKEAFRAVFDIINIIYYILLSYGMSCFYFYRRS